ncbi:MAG: ABC transporter ATP-binding protein [Pseudomonadales bacterium]
MVQTAAITLTSVTKRFGLVEAVRGIDLEIREAEFLVMIGPSGCGKTTTLRMIAGLETPTSGDIFFYDKRVNEVKPWHRDTPLVWQNFTLFPHMNVAQNIEYGLRMRGVAQSQRRDLVRRVVSTIGLEGLENRSVMQLSGGEKQRVGLARAIVLDPKILLLDEPLGALDAKIARSMQRELRRLHRELGITFVYVTHNQSEAMAMADRVVVMNDGRIQQVGTPQEVYRTPRNRFIAEFVGANNVFSGAVHAIADGCITVVTPQGCFAVATPADHALGIGDNVTFVIGADKMKIGGDSQRAGNTVEGRVVAAEFTGSVATVFVELEQGFEFQVQKLSSQFDQTETAIGSTLRISWTGDDAYLLTGSDEAPRHARSQAEDAGRKGR